MVVVHERNERSPAADEEGRCAVAQPLVGLGEGKADFSDTGEAATNRRLHHLATLPRDHVLLPLLTNPFLTPDIQRVIHWSLEKELLVIVVAMDCCKPVRNASQACRFWLDRDLRRDIRTVHDASQEV